MSRWFRHYAGMMRDDKLVSVAIRSKQTVERVVWVWGAVLESAAEIDDGGRYDVDAAEIAYFLRADEADVGGVLRALEDAGRVRDGAVVKWGDRQFQSDRSAERQKRYREKHKGNVTSPDSDGEVTPASRHGDAPEAETKTKTEVSEANASGAEPPSEAKKVLWSKGKALLVDQAGLSKTKAGEIFGRWVKLHGAELVAEVVELAIAEPPGEVVPWFEGVFRARNPQPDEHETQLVEWIAARQPRMRPDERLEWARAVLKPIAGQPSEALRKGIRDGLAEGPRFPNEVPDLVARKVREWARLDAKPAPAARKPEAPKPDDVPLTPAEQADLAATLAKLRGNLAVGGNA